MANTKTKKSANTAKKKGSNKEKRTSAEMTVKVNGKKVEHPMRKFFIMLGIVFGPLIVGLVASLITGDAQRSFGELNQPNLAPPAWLFPVAWTILYILMGVAAYLIYRLKPKTTAGKNLRQAELAIFCLQLVFNFMWTILFFKLELRFFAFGWLVAMWIMILVLIVMAFKNRKSAAWLLVPYLLWCTFAAYLNIAVAMLN